MLVTNFGRDAFLRGSLKGQTIVAVQGQSVTLSHCFLEQGRPYKLALAGNEGKLTIRVQSYCLSTTMYLCILFQLKRKVCC